MGEIVECVMLREEHGETILYVRNKYGLFKFNDGLEEPDWSFDYVLHGQSPTSSKSHDFRGDSNLTLNNTWVAVHWWTGKLIRIERFPDG